MCIRFINMILCYCCVVIIKWADQITHISGQQQKLEQDELHWEKASFLYKLICSFNKAYMSFSGIQDKKLKVRQGIDMQQNPGFIIIRKAFLI